MLVKRDNFQLFFEKNSLGNDCHHKKEGECKYINTGFHDAKVQSSKIASRNIKGLSKQRLFQETFKVKQTRSRKR